MSKPAVNKASMSATSAHIYFSNRRHLSVRKNADGLDGLWEWRYVNGNGNTIAEGVILGDDVLAVLSLAAKHAGIEL